MTIVTDDAAEPLLASSTPPISYDCQLELTARKLLLTGSYARPIDRSPPRLLATKVGEVSCVPFASNAVEYVPGETPHVMTY